MKVFIRLPSNEAAVEPILIIGNMICPYQTDIFNYDFVVYHPLEVIIEEEVVHRADRSKITLPVHRLILNPFEPPIFALDATNVTMEILKKIREFEPMVGM